MIEAEKARYPVALMCRVLDLSTSGFYSWYKRPPSQRDLEKEDLLRRIRVSHINSRGTYGSPRIHADLVNDGVHVSKYRVTKIMSQNGLRGRRKGRFVKNTDSNHDRPIAPDLLDRSFTVDRPDKIWVSDICYLRTDEGWLFLCAIIDLYSRRIVGWAMQDSLEDELVLRAFHMALMLRQTPPVLIFHSDRGSQYASNDFQDALRAAHCLQSMSSKGDPFDNAVAESFFSTFRVELTYNRWWKTRTAAMFSVHSYISTFYNHVRRHSTLGFLSPDDFEALTTLKKDG